MIPKKKLQVFVSSTYVDLKEERQAAVEAILNAGHIPAGMELFAAGDQSQMEVIRRWIDESDVYLLILGGRYGSIEPESGKSYIHLEYEYAIEKGMPHFALVVNEKYLDEKIAKDGKIVLEQDNNREFKAFKQLVTAQKVVRFWSDLRDIKYFILESLNQFEKREELIGWIKGDQAVNSGEIAEQIARLSKENAELREKLSLQTDNKEKFNGLTYNQLYDLLLNESWFDEDSVLFDEKDKKYAASFEKFLQPILLEFQDEKIKLIHLVWFYREKLLDVSLWVDNNVSIKSFKKLAKFGLIDWNASPTGTKFYLTKVGRNFILRLIYEKSIVSKGLEI